MKFVINDNPNKMNWVETMFTISKDEQFKASQNFDPDNLTYLAYFDKLPDQLIEFCFSLDENGTEPYFEDVLNFVLEKILTQ